MGITGEVLDDMLGTAERPLGIDDPVEASKLTKEAIEAGGVLQRRDSTSEAKLFVAKRSTEEGEELTSEHTLKRLERQEESLPASNPPRAIRRQTTGGNQAVGSEVLRIVSSL